MKMFSVSRAKTLLLWLLTLTLGISLGAGLYESRVVLPTWASLPPQTWPNPGLSFWAFVTTGPLTLLLLAGGLAAARDHEPRRSFWLRALGLVLIERLATFGYFIPTMLTMMAGDLPPLVLESTFSTWQSLNYGRHLLTFFAWLCAQKALASQPR